MKNTLLLLAFITTSAMANIVAVIDSGVDYQHRAFEGHLWVNELENFENGIDDDGNGFIDDTFGWNFANYDKYVIDYKYANIYNADIARFFNLQSMSYFRPLTENEIGWMRNRLSDPSFKNDLNIYGNYMHGTHVAGIVVNKNRHAKVLPVKIIPTDVQSLMVTLGYNNVRNRPFGLNKERIVHIARQGKTVPRGERLSDAEVSQAFYKALDYVAVEQSKSLLRTVHYIKGFDTKVANGSFGIGVNQARPLVQYLYNAVADGVPANPHLMKAGYDYFMYKLETLGKDVMHSAPEIFFVFAAGNDGSNNDLFGTYPADCPARNKISVAASLERSALADFSNYGQIVDVAAPGVAIRSAVPGNHYLRVSGTSQAAPYVADVASQMLAANPTLRPYEVKEILMRTVDLKPFLRGKVRSEGIVNAIRAVKAARYYGENKNMISSIARARRVIPDMPESKRMRFRKSMNVPVLPLPSTIR